MIALDATHAAARRAALTVEHGLRLATTDHGFARFPRLEWFDPLR